MPAISSFTWSIIVCLSLGGISPFAARFILRARAVRYKDSLIRIPLLFTMLGCVLALTMAAYYWFSLNNEPDRGFLFEQHFGKLKVPALEPELYIDRLAIFFLALVAFFALLIALYSWNWLVEDAREINGQHVAAVFNFLVLATLLTVLFNNVFYYLCALEAVTLSFSYLALYRHKKYSKQQMQEGPELEATRNAFKVYLIFNHTGVILVTLALVILAVSFNNLSFSAFRIKNSQLDSNTSLTGLIFFLGLLGYSIKAGFTPFHVWVAKVHPYSPTSIHAILSGVILKVTGVYGLLRLFFDFLRPEWWWGVPVLVMAGVTALVGVFYALVSQDLKTALANHSVENLGIILAGIGLGVLFIKPEAQSNAEALNGLARLALIASLYHVLNHAVFKSLLFLCTASIERITGTVKLEELGGLMKIRPWTSTTFLVGAVSISGFPPFNGFISEWLTLQAFFGSIQALGTGQRFIALSGVVISLLLLSTAFSLTAMAFVKLTGETLLGFQRTKYIPESVPLSMNLVMGLLGLMCLLLGLFSFWLVNILEQVIAPLRAFSQPAPPDGSAGFTVSKDFSISIYVPGTKYQASISWLLLLAFVVIPLALLLFEYLNRRVFRRSIHANTGSPEEQSNREIWTGGTTFEEDKMVVTGSAFSSLVWLPFSRKNNSSAISTKSRKDPRLKEYLPSRLPLTGKRYVTEIYCLAYNIALNKLSAISNSTGRFLQNGNIRRYLLFILAMFVGLLMLAFTQWT